jgi:hypothetical protein
MIRRRLAAQPLLHEKIKACRAKTAGALDRAKKVPVWNHFAFFMSMTMP